MTLGFGGRVVRWRDRMRTSLFFVPLLFVVLAVIAAELALAADAAFDDLGGRLPISLSSTVDGARAVLTTVATATVTVAGIAFSVALLVFQMASSQYSPRVIGSLFRDPFNKRVIGLVVGTFAYCLVVLRTVRGPLDGGDAVVPGLSVALAALLGLASLLAIVAFIDHAAHSMEVSELLQRITDDTVEQFERFDRLGAHEGLQPVFDPVIPAREPVVVRAQGRGWVQHVDGPRILRHAGPGALVRLAVGPGRYVTDGTPICEIWFPPDADDGDHGADQLRSRIDQAVHLGRTRTLDQDPAYGIRQLADVAIIALSPGVNDPTTAQDAIFHLVAALTPALRSRPATAETDGNGAVLVADDPPSHRELIELAFAEIRRDGGSRPAVCRYLLEALHLLDRSVADAPRADEVRAALRDEADLLVTTCEAAEPLPADLDRVRASHRRRFPSRPASRRSAASAARR